MVGDLMNVEYEASSWDLTKRLLGYMRPFLPIFFGIVITAFGRHGVFALLSPLLVMLIIDYIVVPVPGRSHWFLKYLKELTGITDQVGLLLSS